MAPSSEFALLPAVRVLAVESERKGCSKVDTLISGSEQALSSIMKPSESCERGQQNAIIVNLRWKQHHCKNNMCELVFSPVSERGMKKYRL